MAFQVVALPSLLTISVVAVTFRRKLADVRDISNTRQQGSEDANKM